MMFWGLFALLRCEIDYPKLACFLPLQVALVIHFAIAADGGQLRRWQISVDRVFFQCRF
jgi:hypothetical protein